MTSDLVLHANGKDYTFNQIAGSEGNYILTLTAKTTLPQNEASLIVHQWPVGLDGQKATSWASEIPIIDRTETNEKQIKSDALMKTGKVAGMVRNGTLFDFQPSVYTFNANVSRLSFDQCMINSDRTALGKIFLKSDKYQTATMGFSFKGNIRIYLNKKEVFAGFSDKLQFKEYTYGRYNVDNKIKLNLNEGKNELIIQCNGNVKNPEILLVPLDHDGLVDHTVNFSGDLNIEYANNWMISFPVNSADPLNKTLDWELSAPQLTQRLVVAPDNLYQKDSYADWHYANGNTMLGILSYYQACGDIKCKDFVQAYARNVEKHKQYFRKQYDEQKMIRVNFYRLFRKTMLDDTGGPVLPLAGLALIEKNNKEYSETLNEMLDYVLNGQQRLENKTFCRPEPVENTVWGDDLFMSVPFLLRMATVNNDKTLYDEVARQIIQFNEVLLDKSTGLYRHAWFNDKKELSVACWGRANGWVAWATSEALMLLPENQPLYDKIKKIHTDHLSSLLKYQQEDGFWHQILTISDDPASYKETSCTAMFSLAMARGVREGWLPEIFRQPALNGWRAVSSRIDDNGNVRGICKSTDLGFDFQHYYNQRPTINDPRGLGSVLTLGSEIYKLIR
jgi:rhamnogalacturonyl hydrolase YesR